MNETPRTDDMCFDARQIGFDGILDCVLADDARILERENAKLRAEIKELKQEIHCANNRPRLSAAHDGR